ncbi:hypothetical protein IMZ31_19085 (plasmid) [Pontibacillus sp. ALD_SL1]|uniref:hypothetical protein n=1 Tax=Pontibacillus sp. ALD_SL1 TaxID=2777185 RepID=UPI001A95F40D|nr:hypothetical protein [Pontibacillus sp. ALD_SL1]QST02655.1 hypothetical protein IMZ31_19085 [Pontibacillus sp. ALD_SL1]
MKECNKCGKMSYRVQDGDYNQFHSIRVTHGYPSDYDGEKWSFVLCEDCIVSFTETFRAKPDVDEYL